MVRSTSSRGGKYKKLVTKAAKPRMQVREAQAKYGAEPNVAGEHLSILQALESLADRRPRTLRYARFDRYGPLDRIDAVRQGLPAGVVATVAKDLNIDQGVLIDHLGMARSTIARKVKGKLPLNVRESESVLGVAQLVGLVERMVLESGAPEGFDAAEWIGKWMTRPQFALGNRRPIDLLDTAEGQRLVATLLVRAQAGVYV